MSTYSGRRVICTNRKSEWYGHVGTITNFNAKSAGVAYDNDPKPLPTGHWARKIHLIDPELADEALLTVVRKRNDIRSLLQKAKESALLSVDVYNKPGTAFRTAAFLVLMTIAWTAAMLAKFLREGVSPYYVDKGTGAFELVDGKYPKTWSPMDCVGKAFPTSSDPVRKNLEFVIGLRNHIEHQHCPELDQRLFGHCQALLSNFERYVQQAFGDKFTVGSAFSLALQPATPHNEHQLGALRRIFGSNLSALLDFVDEFDAAVPDEVYRDARYRYRVMLVPVAANNDRKADAAVTYLQWDPNTTEAATALKHFHVLVKPKEVAVSHPDDLLPGDVSREVQARLRGHRFQHSAEHPRAVKHFKIHSEDPKRPELCDSRYCIWHRPTKRYLYHRAWVEKLVAELGDTSAWPRIIGWSPRPAAGAGASGGRA